MAQTYEVITPESQTFIAAQPLFFVATAPLDAQGHVNLSPKGEDGLAAYRQPLAPRVHTIMGQEQPGLAWLSE